MHKRIKYYLVDVIRPIKGNYILIESLNNERNASRIIHLITPNEQKNQFRLGRGHEADVRVTDISVSRLHAFISCEKDGFFLQDNKSKFGTLSLISKLELNPMIKKNIQIGRTIVSFSVKSSEIDSYFY